MDHGVKSLSVGLLALTLLSAAPGHAYEGVVPGTGHGTEGHRAAPGGPEGPVTLDWLGFQLRPGGGSRLFVQLSRATPHRLEASPTQVVVYFPGARAPLENTLRPLDLRYFATPIGTARVERRRDGLALVVDLREPATATLSEEAGEGGQRFVYLSFGPPS